LLVATLGGCYTTGTVGYRGTYQSGYGGAGEVYATTPDLVTVSPGVQVVADYDEPVFYTDGFYWRFYDGYWYRSNNYATGWYFVERPPVTVLRIDRPYAYAHYRPSGYVVRNRGRYRPADPIVRDHRQPAYRAEPVIRDRREPYRETYRAAPAPAAPPARGPSAAPPSEAPPPAVPVRDHRRAPPADKKDDRVRDHRN
jgi:hypothetical protein